LSESRGELDSSDERSDMRGELEGYDGASVPDVCIQPPGEIRRNEASEVGESEGEARSDLGATSWGRGDSRPSSRTASKLANDVQEELSAT